MHKRTQERIESAIVKLIAQFPGLLGPVAIRSALKTVFGFRDAQVAAVRKDLALIESIGMISGHDLGGGHFVYWLTEYGESLLDGDEISIRLRRSETPRQTARTTVEAERLAACAGR